VTKHDTNVSLLVLTCLQNTQICHEKINTISYFTFASNAAYTQLSPCELHLLKLFYFATFVDVDYGESNVLQRWRRLRLIDVKPTPTSLRRIISHLLIELVVFKTHNFNRLIHERFLHQLSRWQTNWTHKFGDICRFFQLNYRQIMIQFFSIVLFRDDDLLCVDDLRWISTFIMLTIDFGIEIMFAKLYNGSEEINYCVCGR
jgi:hypothetical protein